MIVDMDMMADTGMIVDTMQVMDMMADTGMIVDTMQGMIVDTMQGMDMMADTGMIVDMYPLHPTHRLRRRLILVMILVALVVYLRQCPQEQPKFQSFCHVQMTVQHLHVKILILSGDVETMTQTPVWSGA